MQKGLDILDDLCKFVQEWPRSSDEDPEHLNELLLEFDLTINQLNAYADETKDYELFQLCLGLQNNLEIFQETPPSSKQVELLCAWPIHISKYLSNRDDKEVVEPLNTFLCDSNWPTIYQHKEIDLLQSSRSHIEQITHKLGKPKSTPEQQELLDLINVEIAEIQESHIELLAGLDQYEHSHNALLEIIVIQINQIDRIGSAAKMIGLHGLHHFCLWLQKILTHIQSTDPKQLISLQSQLLLWPDVVQAYLFAPTDTDYIQAALEYINQECWPLTISAPELEELEKVFNESVIEIDTSLTPARMREATADNISLDIPDDVHVDLVNSLLLDLPKQTEEFSTAVQNLNHDDYLEQLEIAKRIAHTLKGAGNTVGIQGLANLTHNLEDILEALLKANVRPTQSLHGTIQNAADCLEEMSEFLHGVGAAPQDSIQIFQEVLNWANYIDEHGVPQESDLHADKIYAPRPTDATHAAQPRQVLAEEDRTTKDTATEPTLRISAHLVDDLLKRAGENIISNAQIQELALRALDFIKLLRMNNNKVKALAQELEHLIEIRGFATHFDSHHTLGKFDPLEMDQFNELHTFANQLMETSADSIEFSNTIEESLLKLNQHSANQAQILRDNQEAVLRTRMISVASIVPRLKRGVRQACKLSNKTAQLEISGAETLIDNEFLNQLVDPLMHLLRNAVDHGIELPEYRVQQGKNAAGKIALRFKKEGNLIHIVCQDDGHGLDVERIKSKALEKELLQESDEFSEADAIQIILRHGFSTKDEVSQLSGRGVGLDAVFSNIRDMKGSMQVDTSFGQGVKVEVTIPTTFHSTHALLASCAGHTLAIANRGIEEILYPGAGSIITLSERLYFQYRQERYPVFDLQAMLYETQHDSQHDHQTILIVHDDLKNKHAVMIDNVFDTRDIVIKPFSRFIPKITGLLGTTILGDGRITTVIDLIELMNLPNPQALVRDSSHQDQPPQEPHPYALIVEDAISTRKSLALFMRDLGFEVVTAKDGVEAIDQIQKQLPAIVLTDLEMPRMNGLELTDHLRSNQETAHTPIIMITSRSTDKHKHEAERLGVSAYIIKPYDEDQLVNLINSLSVAV